MIDVTIRCTPPSTTAQQKGLFMAGGRPRFYTKGKLKREEQTWAALLAPHVPDVPILGPVRLVIRMCWPHPKSTKKADLGRVLPKVTKPDAGNAAKHIEDLLVKMRFIGDDMSVVSLLVEKFVGPAATVGIQIRIAPWHDTIGTAALRLP